MRAIVCRELGGLETLEMQDLPPAELQPGQVRVAVKAAGLNFADNLLIAGKYQQKQTPPFVPGFEVSGVITELGAGVEGLAVGQRVMALLSAGGFADEAVAQASDTYAIPDAMDWTTAAGFPVAYATAHHGLVERGRLKPGDSLLVHGAAGGVGLTAVEVAAAIGARVIATAGGPEKVQVALDHGAAHGIDYKTQDIRETVKGLTGGVGCDVAYDPVGGDMFEASLRSLAPGGRILVIGFASGTVPQIPANILLVKNATVIGYWFGAYRTLDPDGLRRSMGELLTLWQMGRLKPHVSATYPLDRAVEALEALKGRGTTGKIVLTT